MPRSAPLTTLDEHPNLPEILGVLAQLGHIDDHGVRRLALAWRNPLAAAGARRIALSPDSPLVVDVLCAFDALSDLFADDLAGDDDYVTVPPEVTTTALKAVRDAIAGAYARPVLRRGQYRALMAAWREVYPGSTGREPDLGPGAYDVKRVLGAMPALAARCHDESGRRVYDGLLVSAMVLDEHDHADAVESAFQAAVSTGRRRLWTLVRRSAAEGLGRMCVSCRRRPGPEADRDDERVLALCADAACALLVADALDVTVAARLTAPLASLVPLPRVGD